MKKLYLIIIVLLLIFNVSCKNKEFTEELTTKEKILKNIRETLLTNEYVYIVEFEETGAPEIAWVRKKITMTNDFFEKTVKEQYFILKQIFDDYKKIVGTDDKNSENFGICKHGNKRYSYFIYDDSIEIVDYDVLLNKSRIEKSPDILDKYSAERIANESGYVDYNTSNSSSSSNSTPSYTLEPTEDEKGFAWAVAEKEVKAKLKSPSTAKFPFSYYGQHIKKSYDNKFEIISYVDAENSFGASIRVNFVVQFEKLSSETYKVIDVTLIE